jgi:hypothetical protein
MNPTQALTESYAELSTLQDLERRLRALTEFDKLIIDVHRSNEQINLDPIRFMQPLVNRVREDIREVSDRIRKLLSNQITEMQKSVTTYGPVTIDIPESQAPDGQAAPEGNPRSEVRDSDGRGRPRPGEPLTTHSAGSGQAEDELSSFFH